MGEWQTSAPTPAFYRALVEQQIQADGELAASAAGALRAPK
jgi:hypothetical protein